MSRTTVSKTDLDKIAGFLKALDVRPVHMEVLPGRVSMTLSNGDELALPMEREEIERRFENWGKA